MKKTIFYFALVALLFAGGRAFSSAHNPAGAEAPPVANDLLKGVSLPCLNWFSAHAGAGWRIFFQTDEQGKPFPVLKARTFNGTEVVIPFPADGKRTVVGLAFSAKAEADLKSWLQPAYDEFLAKPQGGVFGAAEGFEGNLYFIVMAGQTGATLLEQRAKGKVDPELQKHLIIFGGDSAPWIKALDIKDKNVPYFLILDEKGEVVHQTSGAYSEQKMEKLSSLAEG